MFESKPTTPLIKGDDQFKIMLQNIPEKYEFNFPVEESRRWGEVLTKRAHDLGLEATLHKYRPIGAEEDHIYLVMSAKNQVSKLEKESFAGFPNWLKYNLHERERERILLDQVVIDLSNVSRRTYFSLNSYINRYMMFMSVVKNAFDNRGYFVPEWVSRSTAVSLYELDHSRSNDAISDSLKAKYEKTYEKAIAEYAQYYARKDIPNLHDLPHRGAHEVKEEYFKKNNIAVRNTDVDEALWKYIKMQLDNGRFQDFLYCKEKRPYQTIRESDGRKQAYFRISFPMSQQSYFYAMVNEFNTRDFPNRRDIETLLKYNESRKPLEVIYLNQNDLANWASLTDYNKVMWALADGRYGDIALEPKNACEEIPVLYRAQDMEMVGKIVARLAREIREYNPLSEKTLREIDAKAEKDKKPDRLGGLDL